TISTGVQDQSSVCSPVASTSPHATPAPSEPLDAGMLSAARCMGWPANVHDCSVRFPGSSVNRCQNAIPISASSGAVRDCAAGSFSWSLNVSTSPVISMAISSYQFLPVFYDLGVPDLVHSPAG